MAVPIADDIRKLLDGLAAKQVTTNSINENIADALIIVNRFAQTSADADQKNAAQKRIAVWLSYISYTEGMSFQTGATPAISKDKEESYRSIAEFFLNLISDEPVDLDDIRRTADSTSMHSRLPDISFTGTQAFEST